LTGSGGVREILGVDEFSGGVSSCIKSPIMAKVNNASQIYNKVIVVMIYLTLKGSGLLIISVIV
jgi:hypothetical protein